MKKLSLIGLAVSAILVSGLSAATPKTMTKDELNKIASTTPLFKNKNIKITKGYEDKELGLYMLNTQFRTPKGVADIPAFVDKDTHVVFVGSAYMPNGEKISMPVNKKEIENGIAFTYGSGKKGEIYLLTDPQCPYCQRLEKQLGKKFEDYKVHVVMFPLSFHDKAKPMTQWILRGKTDAEKAKRMKEVMNGSDAWKKDLGFKGDYKKDYQAYMNVLNSDGATLKPEAKKQIETDKKRFFKNDKELKDFKSYLEKSAKSFKEAGAKGTPTVLDKDLKPVNPGTL